MKTLEATVDNVHRIMAHQSELKTACDTIEAYQNELDADIESMSNALNAELEELQLQVRFIFFHKITLINYATNVSIMIEHFTDYVVARNPLLMISSEKSHINW